MRRCLNNCKARTGKRPFRSKRQRDDVVCNALATGSDIVQMGDRSDPDKIADRRKRRSNRAGQACGGLFKGGIAPKIAERADREIAWGGSRESGGKPPVPVYRYARWQGQGGG